MHADVQEAVGPKRNALVTLGLCAAVAAAIGRCGAAAAAESFDGGWTVDIACDSFHEAQGYHWSFPATVAGGQLHGIYGRPGTPESFDLSGRIEADGTARFFGKGLTGNPAHTLGVVSSGTPFTYHAVGNFAGDRGQAKRVEARPCTLTFIRQ